MKLRRVVVPVHTLRYYKSRSFSVGLNYGGINALRVCNPSFVVHLIIRTGPLMTIRNTMHFWECMTQSMLIQPLNYNVCSQNARVTITPRGSQNCQLQVHQNVQSLEQKRITEVTKTKQLQDSMSRKDSSQKQRFAHCRSKGCLSAIAQWEEFTGNSNLEEKNKRHTLTKTTEKKHTERCQKILRRFRAWDS